MKVFVGYDWWGFLCTLDVLGTCPLGNVVYADGACAYSDGAVAGVAFVCESSNVSGVRDDDGAVSAE